MSNIKFEANRIIKKLKSEYSYMFTKSNMPWKIGIYNDLIQELKINSNNKKKSLKLALRLITTRNCKYIAYSILNNNRYDLNGKKYELKQIHKNYSFNLFSKLKISKVISKLSKEEIIEIKNLIQKSII